MRLVVIATALLTPPAAPAAGLSAGFGSADITPVVGTKPVYVAGFGPNRVATGVLDPLTARAVVLGDGDKLIALVSVDLVGLFLPTVEAVRGELPGFAHVTVSCTHTHSGPDTLGLWGRTPLTSGVDPAYLKRLQAGCVAAVRAAKVSIRPVTTSIGRVAAPELLADNRLPVVKHDELVTLKFTDTATGKPAGVVVQWNCHPETLGSRNTRLSSDFVGPAVAHVESAVGCPVVYLTGTVGGLLTSLGVPVADAARNPLADGTAEKTARYGELLGVAAVKALGSAEPVTLTPFTVRTTAVLVRVDNPLYKLGWAAGVLARPIYKFPAAGPGRFAPTNDVTEPAGLKTEVGYLKLGDLEVALIPGEIYPELVLGKVESPAAAGADFPDAAAEPTVYAQLRGKHRMLVGLANDELGYFVPKRQWDAKPPFCYGRTKAQYGEENSVGPDAAGVICEAFRGLVTRPAGGPR